MGKRSRGRVLAWVIGAACALVGATAYAETGDVENAAGEETSEARGALVAEPSLCARCMRGCMRGEPRWMPWDCESLCAILLCRPERRVVIDRSAPGVVQP